MAIFNKPDQQPAVSKPNSTVIASNTKIKGTIKSECTLQIDGSHEGLVKAGGTVIIGNSGKIEGDVAAKKLTVTGLFHGTADCEYVEVRAGGSLRGKVISNNLTIDQNCSFEGESVKRAPINANLNLSSNNKPADAINKPSSPAPKQVELPGNISGSKNPQTQLPKRKKAF